MDGSIVLNARDTKAYQWAIEVLNGKLTIVEFSKLTEKSYRQAQRIVKNVKEKSVLGLKHGNLRRSPVNKTSDEIKMYVMKLLKNKYQGFNLTHFREKLVEDEGILVQRETLRKWAHQAGLVKRAQRRNFQKVHKPRPRLPRGTSSNHPTLSRSA